MWFLKGLVSASSLEHQAHKADPGTANPQCFAKAGKMEPNHLLNGFGPLQPAVAMLWWLPELLLSAHNCTSQHQWQLLGEWLKCDTCCSNLCPIKPVTPLTTLVRTTFLSECCLSASERIDIPETLSAAVSKIAEGEGRVVVGQTCCVRYFRNTALTYLWENARLSR